MNMIERTVYKGKIPSVSQSLYEVKVQDNHVAIWLLSDRDRMEGIGNIQKTYFHDLKDGQRRVSAYYLIPHNIRGKNIIDQPCIFEVYKFDCDYGFNILKFPDLARLYARDYLFYREDDGLSAMRQPPPLNITPNPYKWHVGL